MTVQKKILDLTGTQYLVQKITGEIPVKISDLQDDVTLGTHIADTDIHVTTADKTTWNTVTSKANDSDVVHKSGVETVAGFKEFANIRATNSIKGINLDSTTTDLNNCYSDFAPYSENKGGNIQYYYCNTDAGTANISNLPEAKAFFLTSITTRLISNSLYVKQILINSNSKTFVRYCNNSTWSSWVNETDSEYVHKSGNETVAGEKTFADYSFASSGYGFIGQGNRTSYILPEFTGGYSGLSIVTPDYNKSVKIGTYTTDENTGKKVLNTITGYLQISTGSLNGVNTCTLEARNSTSSLGTSANKWSKIYGTEYYYGSNNVEFSTKFVTTDTNQTISGVKTFTNDVTVNNSNATVQADIPNLVFKNPLVERASATLDGEQTILFTDKNDNNIASIQAKTYTTGRISDLILTSYNENDGVKTTGIVIRRTPTTSKFHAYSDNITTLGETNRRWKSVYAMSYYYGSDNVEFSTKFVTTDTNQTISGAKTFSDTLTIYNPDSSQATKNLTISSSKIQVGDTSNSDSFGITFNAGLSYVSRVIAFKDTSGTQNLQLAVRTKDSSNNLIYSMIRLRLYANGFSSFESDGDNLVSLGSSSNKWKDVKTYLVNGLEPSSLGMPDFANGVDISSYIPALDSGGNTQGSYTPNVNGFIAFRGIGNGCSIVQGNMGNNVSYVTDPQTSDKVVNNFLPVVKDNPVVITARGLTLISLIYFYPCQGNV